MILTRGPCRLDSLLGRRLNMSACLLPLPLAHGPVQGSGMPSKCTFIWADEHAHGKFRLWHFPLLEEGQNFYVEFRGVLADMLVKSVPWKWLQFSEANLLSCLTFLGWKEAELLRSRP